jgi:Fe/S biogenesis protein NfuA
MPEDPILTITDKALAKVLEIRAQEPDADDLALGIKVSGINGTQYAYEMAMVRLEAVSEGNVIEHHGELPVFVPQADVEKLRGASLDMSRDLLNPGLVIDNPNGPSPAIGEIDPEALTGPVAQRVQEVLDRQINPSIASHGGIAQLVAVEESTAYLRLGGGCQGCGLASVTLSQGIETALLQSVPEITSVVDVTDHSSGENPYYEAAKK